MSKSPPKTTSSTNFQLVFDVALKAYDEKTGNSLLTHPHAAKLQSCNSPPAVLSVLQELVEQFEQNRSSDERLRSWLKPTVNVLYAFSTTIGEGAGSVDPKLQSPTNCVLIVTCQMFSPEKAIFTGIGILLLVRNLLYSPIQAIDDASAC
jgi:hypothetical protein